VNFKRVLLFKLVSHNFAEVQRAVGVLRRVALNAVIAKVQAVEDKLVFAGTNHTEFVRFIRAFVVQWMPQLFSLGKRDHWASNTEHCSIWYY